MPRYRTPFARGRRLAMLSFAAVPACGAPLNDPSGACNSGLLAGDLVITELMIDPPGSDSGNEWFELYNATTSELNLRNLLLLRSREDGTNVELHRVRRDWLIAPQTYAVAGAILDDEQVRAVAHHIDYGYADDLGSLSNDTGRIALACDEDIIDEVLYVDPSPGASRGFNGDRSPDAIGNDDLNQWCDATTEFGPLSQGTPQAPNDLCLDTGGPVSCIDNGLIRPARPPGLGDVVITEIMANPEASAENDGEWVELYVGTEFDLNGLAVGTDGDGDDAEAVASNDCIVVTAGTSLVFARSSDPTQNGGLPRVDYPLGPKLTNANAQVVVTYAGSVLDIFAYATAAAGASLSLDPSALTIDGNDDPRFVCSSTIPYGAGDRGTPGTSNEDCVIPPPPGQCLDGESFREIRGPGPGDLVITELLPNPDAVGDSEGEWFELYAMAAFDLNGLQLGREIGTVETTIDDPTCLTVAPDDVVVLAHERDPAINGGLPAVDAVFDFALVNSSGTLWVGYGGTVIDEVTWASSSAGASRSLDPNATDPDVNDDPAAWCDALAPYGLGDRGSPGARNPSCGVIATGTCLANGVERELVAPQPGDLVFTELMPDPSAVTDANGEWFELLIRADLDLNGLQFGDDPRAPDLTLAPGGECLSASEGQRLLFARNPEPVTNGGLPAVFSTFGFGLTNGGGMLFVGTDGTVLDAIAWSSSLPGTAWSVDPRAEDPVANDDPANLCPATTPYGAGDLGSPGAIGFACGEIVVGDGLCLDRGMPRPIVAPAPGDLVINEWMPNPDAVPDSNGEWFEVRVNAPIDLNGLQLSRQVAGVFTVESTLTSADCLPATAGLDLLFARHIDPATNGGLPAVDVAFNFSLNNTNSGLAIGWEDTILDQIQWSSSTAGVATSLDPSALTPTGNDDPANLCPASTPYGSADDLGSPGAGNPPC